MIKKYVPNALEGTFKGRFYRKLPVSQIVIHKPYNHPTGSPINKELCCVEVFTSLGSKKWHGCQKAYIDSTLRVVIELLSGQEKDEVIMKWENCYD